jgi:CheY-like chemotaxis protein
VTSLIMVVEDDEIVRQVARSGLAEQGYSVIDAPEADTALDLLEQHPEIDTLITDLMMPGKSGVELAQLAMQRRPGLKVMFVTAYANSTMLAAAEILGGILLKPYRMTALLDMVRRTRSSLEDQ